MSRFKRSALRKLAAGVGCLAVLALVWIAFGCGRSDTKKNEHLAIRADGARGSGVQIAQPAELEGPPLERPQTAREVSYEEAEAAYNDKRYEDAVELFSCYADQKGENPWGFYMLGLSAWKAGENERAEAAFARAIELDPRHVKSFINLSRVLLETGRPDEAMEKIDSALAIDPRSNTAYRLKGRASALLGDKDDAIAAYRKAIEIDDKDAWSMNNLALIYIQAGRFGDALPPLARAAEIETGEPIFFNNLGMSLEGTGRFRAAEDAYRSAVALDGSYGKAETNLARIDGVAEDPGVEPVTLEALALSFVEEIASWREALAAIEASDSVGARLDAESTAETDSVVVRGDGSPGTAPGE
jgi:Flp pilus assembly protein TadD